jgi:hypothetical protein
MAVKHDKALKIGRDFCSLRHPTIKRCFNRSVKIIHRRDVVGKEASSYVSDFLLGYFVSLFPLVPSLLSLFRLAPFDARQDDVRKNNGFYKAVKMSHCRRHTSGEITQHGGQRKKTSKNTNEMDNTKENN